MTDPASMAADPSSLTEPPPELDRRLFNESIERSMRVLGLFQYEKPTTIADVARTTGIGRSAAQRYVYTWHMLGYIKRADRGNGYVLTPKVLDIATRYLRTNTRLERAQAYLAECARRTLETVLWGELDGTDFVLLLRIPSPRSSNVNTPIGSRYPAHTSSSGLAMLAFMEPAAAAAVLDRSALVAYTAHTVTDRPTLDRMLAEVREKGYCITEQHYSRGAISISAPVFEQGERPVAAVNISTFLSRHSRQSAESELVPAVVETAQIISSILGNSGRSYGPFELG